MKETDIKINSDASSGEDEYEDIADNEDEDDEDMGAEEEPTTCLFCPLVFSSLPQAIKHLDSEHKIKLPELQQKFQMDEYDFIKLINYIRAEKISPDDLLKSEKSNWDDEKYLKPQEYEPWLCIDFDSLKPEGQVGEMTVAEMRQRLVEQGKLLQQANDDMERMRQDFKALLAKVHTDDSGGDADRNSKSNASSLRNNPKFDKEYFNSYSYFGIHHEMLSDTVRTSSYRRALIDNSDIVSGKTVLDVGCGTSILSIFASQAGAAKVVGVDDSEIVYTAMDIVRKNKLTNIHLVKGRLEDTVLPDDKYDIIISEWMGYFLLYESMLDSIIYARENHLKSGGLILPNRCTLSLFGHGDDKLYGEQVEFWSDVYGVDMTALRGRSIQEPLMEVVQKKCMLTEPEEIASFDMMTVDLGYPNFTYNFNLKCTQSGKLSAFVGYFDTFFDLPHSVMFSTSPVHKSTHWKQTIFFLEAPQAVNEGDVITGTIHTRRNLEDIRSLNVEIKAFGKSNKYNVN
ncbi:LOW QUALITY PROTEIN: protein arginine N-methyltransferase 1 [Drosophila tropicalis]|uniref:LOW QUALITY PROTEIN: protein arginine N-methyltransferase 1 n=1 Tax=Drosophila tropicalis TaxID=46794 RepID=UPI0035ABA009